MRNLTFKYAAAYNFLCFGPEGIELHLEKMGNILLVLGENWHDVHPITGLPGSNGSGKSSTVNIFTYALYGKIASNDIKHSDVIHKAAKKNCKVEIIWDKYRVVRSRKPDELRLWESEEGVWDKSTEITCGAGVVETQKKIESILGMNYKSFVGVTVFDDRNEHGFLEVNAAAKREIVENLLSLEKYREYNKVAKAVKQNVDKTIKDLTAEYDRSLLELEVTKTKVHRTTQERDSWRDGQRSKINALLQRIIHNNQQMKDSDIGAALERHSQAQSRILLLEDQSQTDVENRTKITSIVEELKTQRDALNLRLQEELSELNAIRRQCEDLNLSNQLLSDQITSLELLESGVVCDHCYGEIRPENSLPVIAKNRKQIEEQTKKYTEFVEIRRVKTEEVSMLGDQLRAKESTLKMANAKDLEISERIKNSRSQILNLQKVPKPELDKQNALLEQQNVELRLQIDSREVELNGQSPYDRMLQDAAVEISSKESVVESKRKEIKHAEAMIPYFKFWVDAFGDDGIRKFVINGVIPTLNDQIEYWLDILIYGNLRLKFDNTLEPTIERVPFDDDPFIYSIMSGGERRRMNLSVIHAFAYIQMLNCGASTSFLFLDEVCTSLDTHGVEAVYNMICELAKTRQVFITTHDPGLLDSLRGAQVIQLERRNGITKMVA